MSFYVSRNSKGVVFDFEHTGSNDSNRIKLREDGSDWYFDYYGNDAAAGIYPVVSFRLGYDSNQGYQHYLFYMDLETGADTLANTVNMYKLFLNGQEQELAQVGRRYATLSYRHPLDIEQTTIGIALSSDIPGTGPGYFELVDSVSSDPSITTVWIDTGNVYDLTDSSLRNKFYNGKYLDLGASGTSTGLSQPDYYFRLRDYTERSQGGTATITGNTLNWYYVDAPSNVITNFTSSTEQNSQSVYQTIAASTSLDAELSGVILASANLNSTTTVTAVTGYLTPASATLSSQASVAVSGGRITRYLAGLNSEFTQTTTATKLFGIILTLSAETAVSATARLAIRHQGSATLSSQAALAVTGKNFVGVSAVLSSAATLACEGRIPQLAEATATLSASMTVTADVTVIPPVRTSADLTAAATMTIVAVKNFGGEVQMDSQFGISFQLDRFRSIVSNSNSQFTQTVIGKRIKFGSANLPAVATQLTAGTNIHIDPFYQIKVEPESRQGTVRPENRVIQVEQETRLNMIL
jgi:hypothetical protein